MPKRFFKHKLLLDEGFFLRRRLPLTNSRFDLKHVTADLGHQGLSDQQVYELATKLDRLVITFNDKDFQSFAGRSIKSGVIGISANLTAESIDRKLNGLLTRSSGNEFRGTFTYLSHEQRRTNQ